MGEFTSGECLANLLFFGWFPEGQDKRSNGYRKWCTLPQQPTYSTELERKTLVFVRNVTSLKQYLKSLSSTPAFAAVVVA